MLETLLGAARLPYLAALAVVTLSLAPFAARVPVERGGESMDSFTARERAVYDELVRVFGSDDELVLSVTHPRLLSAEGIALIDGLTERISSLDGVDAVQSLSNAIELAPGPYGAEPRALLPRPVAGADYAARARRSLERNPELEGFLIAPGFETTALRIALAPRAGPGSAGPEVVDALRAEVARLETAAPAAELHLTGLSAQKLAVTRLLERDRRVLVPAALGMLALVLAAWFRRASGVWIPLAVTGVTLVWTLGIYGLCGLALNPLTSLLPPVVMVLSVSTSVHVYEGWRARGDRRGADRIAAAVRELRRPCAFTSLTTALGMLSLTVSDTPAVRVFGIFSALGALISLGVGLTLVPVALSTLRDPGVAPSQPAPAGRSRRGLDALLQATARASLRWPGTIALCAALLTALSLAGIGQVRTNTDLIRFLKPDHELFRDAMFIDENLQGIYALEFVLTARDGSSLATLDAVRRLEQFRRALLAHEEVGAVESVLSLLGAIGRAEGRPAALPQDEATLLADFDLLEAASDRELVRLVIDPELRRTRLRARIGAIGTHAAAPLVEDVLAEARAIFGPGYRLEVTGSFHQLARDSDRLVAQQVTSFALALALVILAVGILFRSANMLLVSIIPNVIPLLWTGGLMGALGIELSTGTAMIASVVIGLAVDDTIHYLTRFRRERQRGRGVADAITATTTRTGRALTITSVVLVLGFWVGALGSFVPTIHFSLLTGATMIGALLCDLLVLPASLQLAARRARP